MKRKICLLFTVIISLCLFQLGIAQNDNQPIRPAPRYQLLELNYEFSGYTEKGEFTSFEKKAIFKIDTETGAVWKYINTIDKNGNLAEYFAPICTFPELTFEQYISTHTK